MIDTLFYLLHWVKLQALDACLGIYNITGVVFLPEELLLLLLGVAVVLAILQTVGRTLAGHRAGEHTDWK